MSRALLAALALICIGGSAVGAGAFSPPVPRVQAPRWTEAQAIGRAVVGYRTAVSVTQDSLARLVRAWTWQRLTTTRLSAIERGTVTAPDTELIAIGVALDSVYGMRLPPGAELRVLDLVNRARRARRRAQP